MLWIKHRLNCAVHPGLLQMDFIYKVVLRCWFRLSSVKPEGESVRLHHALAWANMFIPWASQCKAVQSFNHSDNNTDVLESWVFARLINTVVPGKRTGGESQPAHVCCRACASPSRMGKACGLAHGHALSHSLHLHILFPSSASEHYLAALWFLF